MRGQSGGKASRSSRRKVLLSLILSFWLSLSLEKNVGFMLCSCSTTEKWIFTGCFSDLQACILSSVELQVLTSSCFKLRTVHNIPVTSNKDGKGFSCKLFLSSYVWMLSMFLMLIFPQSQTQCLPLLLSVLSVLSLNSNTKVPFTLSAQKSHIMRGRWGLCRRECRLQYVSHPARSSWCHAVCQQCSQALPVCIWFRSPRYTTFIARWWH